MSLMMFFSVFVVGVFLNVGCVYLCLVLMSHSDDQIGLILYLICVVLVNYVVIAHNIIRH